MKTIEIEWITDRVPTEEDATHHNNVLVPDKDNRCGFEYRNYRKVKDGEPWHPAFKLSQPEPVPELDTSLLPEGWTYVYRGKGWDNGGEECFFSVSQNPKGKVRLPHLERKGLPLSDSLTHYWELIPPAQVPWEKPSDVPKEAVWFRTETSIKCFAAKTWDETKVEWINGGSATYFCLSEEFRYSDRPFDNWEDGKPCSKEGGAK